MGKETLERKKPRKAAPKRAAAGRTTEFVGESKTATRDLHLPDHGKIPLEVFLRQLEASCSLTPEEVQRREVMLRGIQSAMSGRGAMSDELALEKQAELDAEFGVE